MKTQGKDGKFYTRDHPHEIINPKVMTFETIRFWLKELSTNPDYGWTDRGRRGLERALGMAPKTLPDKLVWSWIWPKEQVRLTARINDILQGYIVPKKFGKCTEGVLTDPPVPPVTTPKPRVLHMQVSVAGIKFLAHDQRPPPKLPSFKDVFKNVQSWDPDKRRQRSL
jgi:hypothetical protein